MTGGGHGVWWWWIQKMKQLGRQRIFFVDFFEASIFFENEFWWTFAWGWESWKESRSGVQTCRFCYDHLIRQGVSWHWRRMARVLHDSLSCWSNVHTALPSSVLLLLLLFCYANMLYTNITVMTLTMKFYSILFSCSITLLYIIYFISYHWHVKGLHHGFMYLLFYSIFITIIRHSTRGFHIWYHTMSWS